MNETEIHSWLDSDDNDPGFQLMTDEEIIHYAINNPMDDDGCEPEKPELEENTCPVSNSEAAHMFQKCLIWLEHQDEANVYKHNDLTRATLPSSS